MGNLIKCPMCDKDISPNAVSCPNCGEPMKEIINTVNIAKQPTSYNLVLESGTQAIKTIKLIRELTNLGLKDAKDVYDNKPSVIMFNLDTNRVSKIKQDFEVIGAKVNLVSADDNEIIDIKSSHFAEDNSIRCPNCKSANCNKIGGASKVVSAGIWGVFSNKLIKSWECKSCSYKW